ncbi:MAG: polysaccharide biosynthesis protein, partial [Geminicoccaceae bacterium]
MVFLRETLAGFARRRVLAISHDFTMASLAFVAAFILRYGFDNIGPEKITIMQYGAPLFGLVAVTLSILLGLHKHLWRYTTADDLTRIIAAVAGACALVFLTFFLTSRLDGIPRSVPLILGALTLIMLAGPRFAVRLMSWPSFLSKQAAIGDGIQLPVLMVGLGPKTEMYLRLTKQAGYVPHRPVAILDMTGTHVGRMVLGVPIVGPGESLESIINWLDDLDRKPAWIIVSDKLDVEAMAELTRVAGQHEVKVANMPSMLTLSDANSEKALDLKPIAIEDLLGRSQVQLDASSLNLLIVGRRVMVTGGGGTIGSELCRQIIRYKPAELCILDSCEYNLYAIEHSLRSQLTSDIKIVPMLTDIRDREALDHKFDTYRPELIFHAAALKHVPMVEANPIEAIKTNVFGTRNVADAAKRIGALGMVLISTDKAVNPTSIMGATKWLAEQHCQALDLMADAANPTRFIVVRFGNVLGSSGSVVPLFRKQLAAGGPLTVTHPDITRYFMTAREATQLVLQAAAHSLDGGEARGNVLVLDMGKPVKVYDMACHMVRLAGLEPGNDIQIETIGLRPGEKL